MALTTPPDLSMFLPKQPTAGAAPPPGPSAGIYGIGAIGAIGGAPPPEQSGSLFSLATLGNLYRDVVNVPVGLYNLVGTAVSDLVRSPVGVIEEAGTLGFAHTDVKVLTPTFVAKIPIDFASNLKNYYLSTDVISHIQQHPLQPVMDALTIAGGLGAAGRFATATGTAAAAEGAASVAEAAASGAPEAGAMVARSAAEAEATNAVVGAAASGSAVLPPAGGMAGALGRLAAKGSPGLAEWMQANAQVLADYRAAALARTDVPGALQAGEDVRNAAATSDALGIMQQPTLPVFGAVRDGLRSVGEVASEFKAADPLTRRAMLLDVTNPEPLMIADPGSGEVFGQAQGIQPGYNPLLRAVWSDPLRSKFLSETVPEWENRVLAPLREQAQVAEEAGTTLERGLQTQLDAAEAAFTRMQAGGAQLVASKGYAGGLFAKRGIEQGVSKIVGSSVAYASGQRREVAGDLGRIVQAAQDMGLTPDEIQTKTHLLLQGLHDGDGFDYTPEELGSIVRDKGWADPEAAARDLVTQTGNFQALTHDEANGLLRMVKNGQIPIEGLWRYSPDPALAAMPERQAFEQKFRATADQTGLTRQHQDMLMMMYDSTAKALERNGGQSAGEIFANMDMRFEESFTPGPGKELRQMGTDPLQGFAARTAIGRLAPGTDVEQLVKRVQAGLNDHITATEAPYTADEAAVVLWDRTRSLVDDELKGIQRKMRTLPLTQRRKLGVYVEKLQGVVDGDPGAWDALKKTKYGKGLTERMTAELSSGELPQKIGSEIRGATLFGPDFATLTRIFRTGDFTTYVHEFGHVLRRLLPEEVQADLHAIYLAKVHPGQTMEQVASEQELFQTRINTSAKGKTRWSTYDTTAGVEVGEGQHVVIKGAPGGATGPEGFTPQGQIGRIVGINEYGKKGVMAEVDVRGVGVKRVAIDDIKAVQGIETPAELGLAGPRGFDWQELKYRKEKGLGGSPSLAAVHFDSWTGPDGVVHEVPIPTVHIGKTEREAFAAQLDALKSPKGNQLLGFTLVPEYEWKGGQLFVKQKVMAEFGMGGQRPVVTERIPAAEAFPSAEAPGPQPEVVKADIESKMDGFAKLEADIATPDEIIAPSEADVQVMDAVEEEMAGKRTGGGDHLYPGTAGYKGLQAAGVHITDEAAWADVPTDLKPGAQVAFAGDSVIDGDVGTVVMLDPTKDIQLGNEILASKYQGFASMDPADYENMPIVYQYGDMKVAMEGNHRIYRARQFGEAKLKVLLVDGKTKVPDVIDVGPTAEAAAALTPEGEALKAKLVKFGTEVSPSSAGDPDAGQVVRDVQAEQAARGGMSTAEEQAAQDAFAAKLAEATPPPAVAEAVTPEAAAAPAAAPGEVAAEVPPVAPPPTPPTEPPGMGPGWSRKMEEQFADDLERWFYKGIKPDNPRLLPIFHVVGEQLTDLWRKMRGYITDTGQVPDEAAKVFDQYVGDVFTQMKSKGDQPVPAALYRGRRRTRTLAGVPDATQTWGDGAVVQQLPAADGTITIQNVRDRAVIAAESTVPKLRRLFGGTPGATPLHPHRATSTGVTTTLKPMEALTARMDEGARVTDAIRSRVLIPTWKDGDRFIQELSTQFDVVGVDDFRAHAGSGGQTGLKAYVVDPAAPDIVQEVEFTTLLGNQHRDAFAYHDQALGKVERDYVKEEQTIARLSQSTHPNQAGVQQSIDEHVKALEALEIQRESGRRYMEQNYEMLRDEVARDFGQIGPAESQRKLVEQFRLFNAKWSERDLFQRGYADFQRLLERSYLPLRIKSAPDENVLDIMEGKSTQAKSALTLDDELAVQGTPAPVYFPHMEQPDRFAYSTPHGQGMRKLARNPHLRGTTGELFKEGNYVTDPFQAYSIRAAKAIKMQDAFRTVQDIAQHYGRFVSHPDNLLEGERLFAPDFATAFYKAVVGVDDRFSAMMNHIDNEQVVGAWREMSSQMGKDLALTDIATAGIESTLGISDKEAASLYQAVFDAIPKAQRELVGVTRRGLDLYAVPSNVMGNLEKQMSHMGVNNFTVAWDSYTHLWRALALYGSPRWVMNNLVGNISMAALEGVKLREVISAATDRTDRWYLHELAKMTDRATEIDRGWFGAADLYPNELAGRGAETAVGQAERFALSQIKRSPVDFAKPFRWWKDFIKGFNTDMENVFRETGFVQGVREAQAAGVVDMPRMRNALRSAWSSKQDMQRMLQEGITERGFQAGMDRMVKTFGDFSTLSPFERNVVRRYVAPFWGFYRHVGTMLIRAPFVHPFKTQLVAQLAREDQEMRAQYGDLPEWTDQMVPFGPMGADGKMTFLSVAGPNPFNPFADLGLSSLHPAIQASVEMLTGRDTFTGQEFTDPNVVTPFGSTQRFRIIRGPNGEPMDAVPVDKVTPTVGEELLNQFPFYPQLKQLVAGGRAYDTQGVLGSINNPVTNSAGQVSSPYDVGNFVGQQAGVNLKSYDIAGYQARLDQERQAALQMAYDQWAGVAPGG